MINLKHASLILLVIFLLHVCTFSRPVEQLKTDEDDFKNCIATCKFGEQICFRFLYQVTISNNLTY